MAHTSSTPVKRARRTLIWLTAIVGVMAAALAGGVVWGEATWAPKLALDLEGGTQVILAAQLEEGQQVSSEQLTQAVGIIRQRVDASGIAESEVSTQGANNVVVSVPGEMDEATRERIERSAQLQFRPVITTSGPTNSFIGEDQEETIFPEPDDSLNTEPAAEPTSASDPNWVSERLAAEFQAFSCAEQQDAELDANQAPADEPLVTCDANGGAKYLLGPVELTGDAITDATAGIATNQQGASTGRWAVNIDLDGEGTETFADISQRLYGAQPPLNQFAFVLDGTVLSAPAMQGLITNGKPSISGTFNQESAQALADQLKFGALPISFTVQSSDTISATLGDAQLQIGIILGLIGLVLVFIYTLIQYRLLGFVTIFSLVVAAILTYLAIALLSWSEGYRLSLAGVAGLIIAIGFTADSFIVYFERIRDELRDGRGLESAVSAGWDRAKRTILASKAVSLLSAIVLYILAVGNVRGFAFTLGVTTIIDVLVFFLFTNPVLRLLARNRFFASGHPATGLDPKALGAVYRGRMEFRAPTATVSTKKRTSSRNEAAKRQTIAERKAAELEDASRAGKDS